MSEVGTQQDYWNNRALTVWNSLGEPLIPNQDELDFHRRHMAPGGDVLVLGATPQLTSLALEVAGTVTSIDYGEDVIAAKGIAGVRYVCMDWNDFFRQSPKKFDTIVTDGGLVCLDFPGSWEEIAANIYTHLRPSGKFSARIYVSSDVPAQEWYEDENLNRLVPAMASLDVNFAHRMQTPPFKDFEVWYTFPPEEAVQRTFGRLALVEMMVPEYEEGERFVSHAWERPPDEEDPSAPPDTVTLMYTKHEV